MSPKIKSIFQRKKPIEKISMDELRTDKIRLEQEESKIASKIEKAEKEKQALFAKGKDQTSQRQQLILARKIKEKDVEAKDLDKNMRLFSRQLRIINGFIQIKKNQKYLKETGISKVIAKMDFDKLQQYVEQASVDGAFQMDKLSDVLTTLEESDRLVGVAEEDVDTLAIVQAMQEAKRFEEDDPEEAMDDGMRKVNEILGHESEELE